MNTLNFILLMAQPATGGQAANPLMQFLPLILIVVVFWFFIIRPQMKRQKELRKFRESLKKGDKVVTTGGIMGKVHEVKDDYLLVEISDGVKIKVAKASVVKDISDIVQQK